MTRVVRNGVTAERSGDVHPLRGRFSILWPSVMTRTALLIVDVQNDFASKDGSLYVGAGEQVVPLVNALRDRFVFDLVVLTQDVGPITVWRESAGSKDDMIQYHPVGHVSFHSTHAKDPNAKLFEPYSLPNGQIQMLWPDHCVVVRHDVVNVPMCTLNASLNRAHMALNFTQLSKCSHRIPSFRRAFILMRTRTLDSWTTTGSQRWVTGFCTLTRR